MFKRNNEFNAFRRSVSEQKVKMAALGRAAGCGEPTEIERAEAIKGHPCTVKLRLEGLVDFEPIAQEVPPYTAADVIQLFPDQAQRSRSS